MRKRNPFGEDLPTPERSDSPFDIERPSVSPADAAARLEESARRVRGLRTQLGAEGLTLSGTRALLEEVSAALDAAARALRTLSGEDRG